MTNEQVITLFNPATADQLTASDLEIMRELTDEQIDALAHAYPNSPNRRSYLRLYDTKVPPNKQIYQLSTWQNLRNVRKFSNQKNLRPYDFLLRGNRVQTQTKVSGLSKTSTSSPKKVVVDLTAQQAAEELRNSFVVEKKVEEVPKQRSPRSAKAATSKENKATKPDKPVSDPAVENSNLPDDQQFTGGE